MACNQNSFGVLYTEISTVNLVERFAEDTGVWIEPRGLFDFIVAKGTDSIHYYKLKSVNNNDDFGALMEIIAILLEQAMEFEKKNTIKYLVSL